jgi:hypothetical protein
MAIGKTGKVIRQGKTYTITEALPSAEIYKSGYMVGLQPLRSSSPKGTQEKPSNDEKKKEE